MQTTTIQVDRQATSLLDMTFWSNIAVMILLLVVNAVNLIRVNAGSEALITLAAPEMILIVSLALCVWLAFGCGSALATKKRLSHVYITCSDNGVDGISLPTPTERAAGESFALPYASIRFAGIVETPITKKHNVPSLKLSDGEKTYIVPALDDIDLALQTISDHMPAA